MDTFHGRLDLRVTDGQLLSKVSEKQDPDGAVEKERRSRVGDQEPRRQHNGRYHGGSDGKIGEYLISAEELTIDGIGYEGRKTNAKSSRQRAQLQRVDDGVLGCAVAGDGHAPIVQCEILQFERHRPRLREGGFN